jgi:hypothetical protein
MFKSVTLTSGDHPVDQLSAVLGQAVQFVYTCWDRIVLNGYLERLQRSEYLVHFFHDVVGISCLESAVLDHCPAASAARTRRANRGRAQPDGARLGRLLSGGQLIAQICAG